MKTVPGLNLNSNARACVKPMFKSEFIKYVTGGRICYALKVSSNISRWAVLIRKKSSCINRWAVYATVFNLKLNRSQKTEVNETNYHTTSIPFLNAILISLMINT